MNTSSTLISLVSKILTAFVLTAVVVSTVVLITRFVGPLPLSVSQTVTQKQNMFTVTGESEITAVPDEAEITAGIEVTNSSVAAAQDKVNETINAISDAVKELGVKKEDIQTQNYSVYPEYDYQDGVRPRITGYRVSTNLRIKTNNFETLNQIIDSTTQLGANQIGGISFSLSKEKEEEVKSKAREEAIADAKADAQRLAQLSGITLGRVIDVQEHNNVGVPVFYEAARLDMAKNAGGAEPTQIEPGSTSMTYIVSLSYETL